MKIKSVRFRDFAVMPGDTSAGQTTKAVSIGYTSSHGLKIEAMDLVALRVENLAGSGATGACMLRVIARGAGRPSAVAYVPIENIASIEPQPEAAAMEKAPSASS